MKHRITTKHRNRMLQAYRRALVHAAGCVYELCSNVEGSAENIADALYAGFPRHRIPRSLRRRFLHSRA